MSAGDYNDAGIPINLTACMGKQNTAIPASGVYAAFLTAAFFRAGAAFLGPADFAFAAAFCNLQRLFVAAMIRFRPSALIFRLVFLVFGAGVVADVGSDWPRTLAHRRCWASFMSLRRISSVYVWVLPAWL